MCESNYFTVKDLIKSDTASRQGIDNQPSEEIRKELEMTACKLNVIGLYAQMKGATIRVTSGYRCPKLNALVGGVKTSLHLQGQAVDFVVSDDKIKHELYETLTTKENRERLRICEVIEYTNFLHVGFKKSR